MCVFFPSLFLLEYIYIIYIYIHFFWLFLKHFWIYGMFGSQLFWTFSSKVTSMPLNLKRPTLKLSAGA